MIDLSTLPGMAPNERNVFFLRRHWFVLIPLLFAFAIVLVLPFVVYAGVNISNPEFFGEQTHLVLYVLGASMFFLYAWLFLFQNFIDYFLDIWIVTTHRILDIEQNGLFGRTTSELLLDRVQDVTSEVHGFIHTIFDYGTLRIQTAGEREHFVFEHVPHPTHVAKRILELAEERRRVERASGGMA
jgi:uncharacterized membrane protein YdbT with pleckstrin-like domain